MRGRLRGGTAVVLAARCAAILVSFLLTVVVARVLSVDEAGVFFVLFTTVTIVATFGRYGVDTLVMKLLSGSGAIHRDILSAFGLVALASSLGGTLLAVGLVGTGYGRLSPIALVALGLTVPALAFAVVAGSILRASGRLVTGVMAELGSVPGLTITVLATMSLVSPLSLEIVLLAFAGAAIASAAWSTVIAVGELRRQRPEADAVDVTRFKDFVRENARSLTMLMLSSLLFYAVVWAPIFALTAAGQFAEVTYFTLAMRLASFLALIPSIQVAYLAPEFARLYYARSIGELNALARRTTRRALAIVAGPAILLVAAAEPIVSVLFGADLGAVAEPTRVLVLGALITVAAGQTSQLMLLCGLEWFALILNAAIIAPWLLFGLFIAQGGAFAAALVSTGLTLVFAATAVFGLRQMRGLHPSVR